MFKEKFGLKEPRNMTNILARTHPYMNYEKKLLEEEVNNGKSNRGNKRSDVDTKERKKWSQIGLWSTPPEHNKGVDQPRSGHHQTTSYQRGDKDSDI